jgi:hypothetical protein
MTSSTAQFFFYEQRSLLQTKGGAGGARAVKGEPYDVFLELIS